MKIIPGKYLNENFEAPKGFVLPQWDFIEMKFEKRWKDRHRKFKQWNNI